MEIDIITVPPMRRSYLLSWDVNHYDILCRWSGFEIEVWNRLAVGGLCLPIFNPVRACLTLYIVGTLLLLLLLLNRISDQPLCQICTIQLNVRTQTILHFSKLCHSFKHLVLWRRRNPQFYLRYCADYYSWLSLFPAPQPSHLLPL